jgi:hypothetical protein
MEPWPCSKPAFNSQMLVRGVIIHDDVHLQVFRHVLFNLPEKTQILLMPMTRSTFREHIAVRRVQCGKQRGGSVASIIMGHSFDITQAQRQHRLGAFQRLNSALLIYAQNHCIFRWIQVQPYNIPYLFYKKWIARKLELFFADAAASQTLARCGAPSISILRSRRQFAGYSSAFRLGVSSSASCELIVPLARR